MQPLKIFMHIPKCAGSTLVTILNRNMKTARIDRESSVKEIIEASEKAGCLHGHVEWSWMSFIEVITGRDLDIYTMVRHPVDRMISQYYYDKRGRHTDKSLKEWIFSDGLKQRNILMEYIYGVDHASMLIPIKFGLVEEFDKSLEMLQKYWGLTDITYNRQNVRGKDEGHADAEELDMITKMCCEDIVLYNRIKDQFMKEYQEFKNV